MKKTIIAISICILFTSISLSSASFIPQVKNQEIKALGEFTADPEEAPIWAVGNFTGRWGLNVWGNDWFTIGPVYGYYGKGFYNELKFGRFLIQYTEDGEENGTIFQGLFIGPFLLGVAKDIYTQNTSNFVGLGGYNETNFRWRIMGMEGPTLFMKGVFNEF